MIHPRDSQEEAPFAESRYRFFQHGTVSERVGCFREKERPTSKAAECSEEVAMATFVKVAQAAEVEPGCGKSFEVNGKRIALFNVEGTLYAIDETCTHLGGSLSEGELDGNEVSCPCHGQARCYNGRGVGPTCAKRGGPIRSPHKRRGWRSRNMKVSKKEITYGL